MKYFINVILLMFTINGFAIQQQLIDAAEAYKKAEKEISALQIKMAGAKGGVKFWNKEMEEDQQKSSSSYRMTNIYKKHLIEEETELKGIEAQVTEIQILLKKLEPLKKEHDAQIKKERDREEFISSALYGLGTVGLPLVIIILFGVSIFRTNRKYKKMLEEGKISQQEYEKLTKSRAYSPKRHRINPATGLPIFGNGTCDVGGNARGSSSRSHDYDRDYGEKHRWDHHDDLQKWHRS